MSKGAVLDEALIAAVGLSDQMLTLSRSIENKHHPILQEPLFWLHTEEIGEPIYLERKYVFDNQVSIKSSYGKGDKVVLWLTRQLRQLSTDPRAPPIELLLARELFLLNDWREFQRFKQFIKSMRILDAQARQWLMDHQVEFPALAQIPEGIAKIIDCLANIAEWPDLDASNPQRNNALELIAKTFSRALAPVRASPLFAPQLLRRTPDVRFIIFRLMSFVEDPEGGAGALLRFIKAIAAAAQDAEITEHCAELKSSRDLSRAFATIRRYLLSSKTPPG